MKRGLITASLGLIAGVAFIAAPVFAYTSPGIPNGYVSDFAKILSASTVENLDEELSLFEASTSNEIAVATIPSMSGDYIENYSVLLFKEWGIGKKDKDNGVLLLLSLAEKKVRIEVGYGLEGALPDSVAQAIINQDIIPLLKKGDYDGAVTAGVHDIEQATRGEYKGAGGNLFQGWTFNTWEVAILALLFIPQWLASIFARSKSWWAGGIVGLVGGLAGGYILALSFLMIGILAGGLTVLGLLLDYFVSKTYRAAKSTGTSVPWWAGGGTPGSSSGGSFGGFGGGSSGGGGASGGW